MLVEVTEFVRPNGREIVRPIRVIDDFIEKVAEIRKFGLRFTLEHLGNGTSSVCLEKPDMGDVLMRIVVSEVWERAVESILQEYSQEFLEEWERMMRSGG